MERKSVKNTPDVIELEPGKYAWCSCGHSTKHPFCDGSHSGSDMKPVVFEVTEKKKVALCACKKSGGAPFCDGSHS